MRMPGLVALTRSSGRTAASTCLRGEGSRDDGNSEPEESLPRKTGQGATKTPRSLGYSKGRSARR